MTDIVFRKIVNKEPVTCSTLGNISTTVQPPAGQVDINASRKATLGCLRISLQSIADAIESDDRDELHRCVDHYTEIYRYARINGLTTGAIRTGCESAYLRCLTAALRGIAYATVDGDPTAATGPSSGTKMATIS